MSKIDSKISSSSSRSNHSERSSESSTKNKSERSSESPTKNAVGKRQEGLPERAQKALVKKLRSDSYASGPGDRDLSIKDKATRLLGSEGLQAQNLSAQSTRNTLQTVNQSSGAQPSTQSLQGTAPAQQTGSTDYISSVAAMTQRVETAKVRVAEIEQELARQIATLGPAMTQSQKEQFVEAFKAKYPEYGELETAQRELSEFLTTHKDALTERALIRAPEGSVILEAVEQLAGSPFNDVAKDFLFDPELGPALRGADQTSFDSALQNTVLSDAIADLMKAGTPDQQKAALDQLQRNISQLSQAGLLTGQLQDFTQAIQNLKQAAGTAGIVNALGTTSVDAGPLSKITTGVAFAMGMKAFADGQVPADRWNAALSMASNADAVAWGMEAMGKALPLVSSRLTGTGSALVSAGAAVGKVTPFIAAVANTVSLLQSVEQFRINPTTANGFNLAAGVSATAGGILMLVPGGQIPGAALTALSTGLSLAGSYYAHQHTQQVQQQGNANALDIARQLDPPLDQSLVKMLHRMGPNDAQALITGSGFTVEQLTGFAQQVPALYQDPQVNPRYALESLGNIMTAYDIKYFNQELGPENAGKIFLMLTNQPPFESMEDFKYVLEQRAATNTHPAYRAALDYLERRENPPYNP
jgi:hypothetical protein